MPISSVAISVEGVLQKTTQSVPIEVGIGLYHSLKTNFNILLYSDQARKSLDYWLSLEALNIHAAVEYNDGTRTYFGEAHRKKEQVNSLRGRGFHIDLVIEPNPAVSSILINEGYSVMTFTHAQYAAPEWRPDYQDKRKPWSEFDKTATTLMELKAMDNRIKDSK